MAMVKVITRFVSGYCLHLVGVFAEMYSCIFSLRAHLVVAGVEAGSSSFQFSCLAVVMILGTASSGGSVVFKQRVMDGGGWFPSSVCGFFGAQGFNAVPGCCVEGVLPELIFLQGFG